MSKLFLTIMVIILALPADWLSIAPSRAGESPRPRNGRIAFSTPVAGGEHIFTIDAQGGSRLQLTSEGSINKFPAWSSDGTTIVFSSNRTGTFELWTMSAGQLLCHHSSFLSYQHFRPRHLNSGVRLCCLSGSSNEVR